MPQQGPRRCHNGTTASPAVAIPIGNTTRAGRGVATTIGGHVTATRIIIFAMEEGCHYPATDFSTRIADTVPTKVWGHGCHVDDHVVDMFLPLPYLHVAGRPSLLLGVACPCYQQLPQRWAARWSSRLHHQLSSTPCCHPVRGIMSAHRHGASKGHQLEDELSQREGEVFMCKSTHRYCSS